jgi:defect-in-organelle-trafficking protein DotD
MNLHKIFSMVAIIVAAGGLSACNSQGESGSDHDAAYDPGIRTEVDQSIAQSAARASNALETLAMIQRARTAPVAPVVDDAGLPPELRRKATIEFSGPSVELARELAQDIGYGFFETGHRPSNPGLISIDAKDESVAKVLEDVGLQSQKFATVIVDPNQRKVEFRYESGDGFTPRYYVDGGEEKVSHKSSGPIKRRHYVKISPPIACVPCSIAAQPPSAAAIPAPSLPSSASVTTQPSGVAPVVPSSPSQVKPTTNSSATNSPPNGVPSSHPAVTPQNMPSISAPTKPSPAILSMPPGMVPVGQNGNSGSSQPSENLPSGMVPVGR